MSLSAGPAAPRRSRLAQPNLRKLRALAILQRRMANTSLAEIGREFNVTATTVAKEIQWAERQGLLESYEQQILAELVPDSIKAVKTALKDGNVKAAIEVLKGTGLLGAKPAQQAAPADGGGESLEIYVRKIGGEKPHAGLTSGAPVGALPTVTAVPQGLAPGEAPALLEGDVLEDSTGAAAPAPPQLRSRSDEAGLPDSDGALDLSAYVSGLPPQPPPAE
jgi:hypothetical protein